jgi:predicted aconitase with swiveling domain
MQLEFIVHGSTNQTIVASTLVLEDAISFWGGVSPVDGKILADINTKGRFVGGSALFIRALKGSSSGSSVLLELIYRHLAPAAIILDTPDAVLALGVIAGREMNWPTPPIFRLPANEQAAVPDGALVTISRSGKLLMASES